MRFLAVVFALLFASSEVALAKGPYNSFKIGNWNGGSFTNDQTGEFSHCAVFASYKSGITLHVSVTRSGEWILAVSRPDWNLDVGQQIPVDLTFDGRGPLRVYAVVKNPSLALIGMPTNSAVLNAFRSAHQMNAFANGTLFGFALDQTGRLMPALIGCVRNKGQTVQAMAPVRATPRPASAAPAAPSVPAPIAEAVAERSKLLSEAAAEHAKCERTQMRSIVPYSNESAATLAQVVLTKCEEAEQKFVSLGMALFNTTRADMEKIVSDSLAKQKNNMVAEIVTFRAELTKAMAAQPKSDAPKIEGAKQQDGGI